MQAETTTKSSVPGRRMTVLQIAEQWQLYPGTIRKAIRRGDLPAVWAGTGYRVLAMDVEAWIQRRWNDA